MFSPLEDDAQQQKALKKRYKRARWGARHLIHESFDDGFPALRDRFARKRIAAEQKYEYNLGTRTFETTEAAEDGMAWLRALFVELDNQCDRIKLEESKPGECEVTAREACATLRSFLQEELAHWRIQPSARVGREKKKVIREETLNFRVSEEGPLCMDLKPCRDGVRVVDIKLNGLAQSLGLRPDDLITRINDLDGPSLGKLPSAEAIRKFGMRPIDLVVKRLSEPRTSSNSPPPPLPPTPDEDEKIETSFAESSPPVTPPKTKPILDEAPSHLLSSPTTPPANKPVEDDDASDTGATLADGGGDQSLFIHVAQYNQSDEDEEVETPNALDTARV